jgi:hypothetical protein
MSILKVCFQKGKIVGWQLQHTQMLKNGLRKSTLLTLVKNFGFTAPNFASLIFNKKMADTRSCGPPFI